MMKHVLMGSFLLVSAVTFGQNMGIGTSNPNASAKLDITDNSRGVLVPRIALTTPNSFAPLTGNAADANGVLVFNTTSSAELLPGFYYWNTIKWMRLQDVEPTNIWRTTGNTATDTSVHFIGTTDNMPLKFRIDNVSAGILTKSASFMGFLAGTKSVSGNNTGFGSQALKENKIGFYNTAVGEEALRENSAGTNNTATGYLSLRQNTGSFNSATGSFALMNNQPGNFNTATGSSALYSNTDGVLNTAAGYKALNQNAAGGYNSATGAEALFYTKGSYNNGIGYRSLYNNEGGSLNTGVGHAALATNVNGSSNTALGRHADVSSGNLENASAIGAGAVVNASNKIRLGDNNVTVIEGAVAFSHPSDSRFKKHVQENVPGLSFIKQLNPVTYDFDTEKYQDFVTQKMNDSTREKLKSFNKASKPLHQTGFIAQQVETAANKLGFEFDGLIKPQNNGGHYSIAYSQFVIPLVQAVKEQQAMIEQQHAAIQKLTEAVRKLEEQSKKNQGGTKL